MSNLKFLDDTGNWKYYDASGEGTDADPFVLWFASGSTAVTSGSLGSVTITSGSASVYDAGPAWTPSFGVSGQRVLSVDASGSAGTAVTDAPTTGKRLVIDDLLVSSGSALTAAFQEETSGSALLSFIMAANTTEHFTPRSKLKLPNINKKLMLVTDTSGSVAVSAFYHSE